MIPSFGAAGISSKTASDGVFNGSGATISWAFSQAIPRLKTITIHLAVGTLVRDAENENMGAKGIQPKPEEISPQLRTAAQHPSLQFGKIRSTLTLLIHV